MKYDLIIIGGGAGGCYAAIRLAEMRSDLKICILEAARNPLSKVEISGGGRCNVTHACFDPKQLVTYYPRGGSELLPAFLQFQPADMVKWCKEKGVVLKTESDGRMFPVTDSSATVINCFLHQIKKHDIQLLTATRASSWTYEDGIQKWVVTLFDGSIIESSFLLIASGSDQRTWNLLKKTGHTIVTPVPSLFTFNIQDKALVELMGISRDEVKVSIPNYDLHASGPLLITHWGLSGPAILKLSAWGARFLFECGYVFDLKVNWLGVDNVENFREVLLTRIKENTKRKINNLPVPEFPSRLWKYLCFRAGIGEFTSGDEFGRKQMQKLISVISDDLYRVTGKSTFKEEFVTAGGVDLADINMNTFESKKQKRLFLAGEVLNIDALTGGYNFQSAWTAAYIVAKAIHFQMKRA